MESLRSLFGNGGTLSVERAAQNLGIPKSTLYEWLQEGTFPGYKVGRLWVVFAEEVVRHLEAGRDGRVHPLPDALDEVFANYGTYLSPNQAATLLDCSVPTIMNWIDARTIPAYKLHGHWVIVAAELRELLRAIRKAGPDRAAALPPDQVGEIFKDAPETLRPKTAAELLGLNYPTIYRWLQEGGIFPAYKLSARRWMILRDEVIAWMRSRRNDRLDEHETA